MQSANTSNLPLNDRNDFILKYLCIFTPSHCSLNNYSRRHKLGCLWQRLFLICNKLSITNNPLNPPLLISLDPPLIKGGPGRFINLFLSLTTCSKRILKRLLLWYGMVWYGMVWYGMVWYGMVWKSSLKATNLPLHGLSEKSDCLFVFTRCHPYMVKWKNPTKQEELK